MLETLFLILVLNVPSDCMTLGDLYRTAAQLRDRGHPLTEVLKLTHDPRVRRTLAHVYERPDMQPEEWRWFAIGICVGAERERPKGSSWMSYNDSASSGQGMTSRS